MLGIVLLFGGLNINQSINHCRIIFLSWKNIFSTGGHLSKYSYQHYKIFFLKFNIHQTRKGFNFEVLSMQILSSVKLQLNATLNLNLLGKCFE